MSHCIAVRRCALRYCSVLPCLVVRCSAALTRLIVCMFRCGWVRIAGVLKWVAVWSTCRGGYKYTYWCLPIYMFLSTYLYIYPGIPAHTYKLGQRPSHSNKPKLAYNSNWAQNSGTDVNNGRLAFLCWYKTDWLHERQIPSNFYTVSSTVTFYSNFISAVTVRFDQQRWVSCPSLLVKFLKSQRAVIFCKRFSIESTFQKLCVLCRYVTATTSQYWRARAQCYVSDEVSRVSRTNASYHA